MKQSLAWHKTCLKNSLETLETDKAKLARLAASVDRHERDLLFYRLQIEEAERRGLGGFDPNRFMKPREEPPKP